MNELSPLPKTAEIIEKIESVISKLRQEQRGREDSIDNEDELHFLNHLTQILNDPENAIDYLKDHNLTPEIIIDTLRSYKILDDDIKNYVTLSLSQTNAKKPPKLNLSS